MAAAEMFAGWQLSGIFRNGHPASIRAGPADPAAPATARNLRIGERLILP